MKALTWHGTGDERVEVDSRDVVSPEDPWRWLTFSAFWGSLYYLLVYVGLLAGHQPGTLRVNRRPALLSFGLYLVTFVAGGSLTSWLQQLIAGRSAKQQSRTLIATGTLERSIPLQALGGAAGAVLPFGLVLAANAAAERLSGEPPLQPGPFHWGRAVAVTSSLSGLAGLAVSRIAGWVAEDAREAERLNTGS